MNRLSCQQNGENSIKSTKKIDILCPSANQIKLMNSCIIRFQSLLQMNIDRQGKVFLHQQKEE